MRRPYAAILGLLVIIGWAGISGARQGAVPAALFQKAQAQGTIRVIVQLNVSPQGSAPGKQLTKADLAQQQKAIATTQDTVLAALKGTGARVMRQFKSGPFVALEVTPDALRALEQSDSVLMVEEDRLVQSSLAESVPKVEADLAQNNGLDGTGWTVVIIDTGVDSTHPFLEGKVVWEACYRYAKDCPNGSDQQFGPGAAIPSDPHGTHVAGIAAGKRRWKAPDGTVLTGVASGANVIAIKVLGSDGLGRTADTVAALDYVYSDLRYMFNIAAINLSLGSGIFNSQCDSAYIAYSHYIGNLRAAGIATIAASGNDSSTAGIASPACIGSAISVGATHDITDQVPQFSNSAAFLSLLAPGQGITSSVPGGGVARWHGTSMATPHVTGAWAIMKQKLPTASAEKVLGALRREGLPITDPKSGVTTPRIQILQALEVLADVYAAQSAPSCKNIDIRHWESGWSGDWCGFLVNNWELDLCRQKVDPLTSAAWSDGWAEDGSIYTFNHRCSFSLHCAVPGPGTIDVPYCDVATAVDKVAQGGTIGLVSGQSFNTPITISKPLTLIAIDGAVSIGQ